MTIKNSYYKLMTILSGTAIGRIKAIYENFRNLQFAEQVDYKS